MESQMAAVNMTKFLKVSQKPTNFDDLRLDALIKQGKQGQIVIVGCPFDFARKRSISKGGQQNGPCCLRRFLYKVGPLYNSEYQINISDVKISDYGNIQTNSLENYNPEKVIEKIKSQVKSLLQDGKFPFIIGGSKQGSLGSSRAFHDKYTEGKHLIISGMPFLKRPFDNDKLTSQNFLTISNIEFPEKQILFGPHQKYFPKDFNKNFEYISFDQIYAEDSAEDQNWSLGFSHKPVKKLCKIINKNIPYHVTLSVEGIQRFSGCRDLGMHGIKPEQMIEIFYWLGQQQNIKSIDITEFNPSCQDYQSSLILINLLYYFLMGWTKRGQNSVQ